MKKTIILLITLFITVLVHQALYSWGFFAHKKINRIAVFTLPPDMIGFYKKHIEYITEQSVGPDKRRHGVEDEAPRHYIDIDHYGESPFEVMPRQWNDAVAKYTEDTLMAYGIVPWHVHKTVGWLTEAFREENLDRILRLSADLGHYIADSHVPLHCTVNYNGHLTDQRGIHAFWESRLPELFAKDYDFFVGRAKYIENTLDNAWEIVEASFAAKDSVLLFEAQLNNQFSPDKKYCFENRGQVLKKAYSEEYCLAYDIMLNGMVERRMRASIITIGSMWYTAWINAGQPDLRRLDDKEVSVALKKQLKEEERMWKTGQIKGREHSE